jgi:hypothetical protein
MLVELSLFTVELLACLLEQDGRLNNVLGNYEFLLQEVNVV